MLRRPFYPLLVAIYPLLFLWSENSASVAPAQLVLPVLLSVSVTALLWFLATKYFGDISKAGIFTGLFAATFFAFGHLYSAVYPALLHTELGSKNVATLERDLQLALLCALLALLVLAHGVLRRRIRIGVASTLFLNAMTVILVLLALMSGLLRIGTPARGQLPGELHTSKVESSVGYLPDIYHIVLDGYGRGDVLSKSFGWDNSQFLNFLKAEGFLVPERSQANYFWTMLSLASTLNMEYLDDLSGIDGRKLQEVYQRLRDNKLSRTLRSVGYEVVHFQSSWGATMHNQYADRQVSCGPGAWQDEFLRLIVETSLLRTMEGLAARDLAECHLQQVENLKAEVGLKGPKYVFAHFIPPHHPYLFDSAGNIKNRVVLANQFDFQNALWGEKESYIEQLQFVSKEVMEIVRAIKEGAAQPPIIVVQSDHGPQLLDGGKEERKRARFANFAAFYLPGAEELIPDDVTAVNYFRYVLDYYFKQHLPPLPSRHIYSDYHTPFLFEEW